MDELTRERFWPKPTPAPAHVPVMLDEELDLIAARQRVLLAIPETETTAQAMQHARLRADALARSRRIAGAIRTYQVRSPR